MTYEPDFMEDAMNVYRTENYIVKQVFGVKYSDVENTAIISYDTYYLRTVERDEDYEDIFWERKHIDGKRVPSTMYTRKYVD